jgi:hypothetical protein
MCQLKFTAFKPHSPKLNEGFDKQMGYAYVVAPPTIYFISAQTELANNNALWYQQLWSHVFGQSKFMFLPKFHYLYK